jgi:hypothetical protein
MDPNRDPRQLTLEEFMRSPHRAYRQTDARSSPAPQLELSPVAAPPSGEDLDRSSTPPGDEESREEPRPRRTVHYRDTILGFLRFIRQNSYPLIEPVTDAPILPLYSEDNLGSRFAPKCIASLAYVSLLLAQLSYTNL